MPLLNTADEMAYQAISPHTEQLALVGSADSSHQDFLMAGFSNLGVVRKQIDGAGFIPGHEGAAALPHLSNRPRHWPIN